MAVCVRHRTLSCGEVVDSCVDKRFPIAVLNISTQREASPPLVLISRFACRHDHLLIRHDHRLIRRVCMLPPRRVMCI